MPGAVCQMPIELLRMGVAQRLQQHAFDDAEDDGVGADADGQRDQRDGGEERGAGEPPENLGIGR